MTGCGHSPDTAAYRRLALLISRHIKADTADVQFLVELLGKCSEALRTPEKIAALQSLILDMGRAIRSLDDNHEHLEFWTQDGGYVLDARF
jgi:hypothetical protein